MLMSFKLVLFAVLCLSIDNLPSDVCADTPTHFKLNNDDASASTLNDETISTVTSCDDCGIDSTNYKSSTSSTTRPDIEDSSELKVNNETCSKCNNQKPSIENITISSFGSNIKISWRPLPEMLEVCKYSYEINRTSLNSIIPYFRIEERNSHLFRHVRACEKYNVDIKANNMCSMGFFHNAIVYSAPETIENLQINAISGQTHVTWDRARSSECSRYLVQVGGKSYDTEDNSFAFEDELYCEEIKVRTIRSDNAVGFETVALMPGMVRKLQVENDEERKLKVTWMAPEDNSCVVNYTVRVTKEEEKDFYKIFNTTETETTVEDLEPCTSYKISVAANSETQTGEYAHETKTTMESVPGMVQKLQVQNDEKRMLKITWMAPEDDSCVVNYTVRVNKEEEKDFNKIFDTTKTETIVEDLEPCTSYEISVAANSETQTGEYAYETKKTRDSVPGMVRKLQVENDEERKLKVTWMAPEDDTCVVNYTVRVTKEGKKDFYKIFNTTDTETIVEDLEPCTSYEISVAANSETQTGEYAHETKTTTDSVPGKVRELQAQNDEERKLKITWMAPEDDTCVVNYTVRVTKEGEKDFNKIFNTTEKETIVEDLEPCTSYEISVAANSETKTGEYAYETKTTTGSVFNPPFIEKVEVGNMSMTLNVSLESKEENNCKLKTVWYECLASKDKNPNNGWVKNITLTNKEIEEEIESEIWLEIDELTGFTNYTCRVKVENEAGCSDFSNELNFKTEEQVPSSPENFETPILESRKIKFTWDEPNMIPGNLTGYKLEYTSKPMHFIPESCETQLDNYTSDIIKKGYFVNEKALPNYLYTAQVSAKTFDYGEPNINEFRTPSGESEDIRNFTQEISSADSIGCGGPNVTLYLYWWHPCNTNGHIEKFTVRVTSGEEKDKEKTLDAYDKEDEMYETSFDLNFYKDYIVNVFTDETSTSVGSTKLTTPEGVPSAPKFLGMKSLNETSFQIDWGNPEMPNGELLHYDITIEALGSRINIPKGCTEDKKSYTFSKVVKNSLQFDMARPFYRYRYQITANTKVGGGCTELGTVYTKESISEPVRNLNYSVTLEESVNYNAQAKVSFDRPCNVNTDQTIEYYVKLSGKNGTDTHEETEPLNEKSELLVTFALRPKFVYTIRVVVENHIGSSDIEITRIFEAPAGVPTPTNTTVPINPETEEGVSVVVEKNLFGEDNGEILYYAIIVGGKESFNESDASFGFWDGNNWPEIGKWSPEGELGKYQATPVKWNPFKTRADDEQFVFKLGRGDCDGDICNGVLRPDTEYAVQIRGFTDKAYRDTDAVYFTTKKLQDALSTMAIIGIVAGVLILVMIVGVVALMYIKRRRPIYASETEIDKSSLLESLTKENFARYYAKLKEDPESLTNEFVDLNNRSVFELTMSEALLTENRKKNRFINILPYDEGRVKLRNEFSDYINASYILGYSNQIEYIATQGPLESTCKDFWQMVVDENVTVIVMLAQFVEQRKEKCYKYFPDNHDEIQFDENLRVRCSAELDFGHYCERQISVQKDEIQHKLIHLQFMGWPDFGCPVGTENVLDLCIAMRRHVEAANGLVIVHCSAGVGRTGTLITIDILLQALNYNCREIDVFNTVLELRKQRKNMVQTEAQYLYIYNCICDAIINPPSLLEIKGDPIYENVELKVMKSDDNENTEYK